MSENEPAPIKIYKHPDGDIYIFSNAHTQDADDFYRNDEEE